MNLLYKIAVLLILVFWNLVSNAQTEAIARLDSNAIIIGDQVNMEISFSCPADYKVIWPKLNDTIIAEIEIIKKGKVDSLISSSSGNKSYHQIITITSFDSGYYAIPPIRFNYTIAGDTLIHFTETEALLLEVQTVQVNTEQEIKDIKEPIEAPFTFREAFPYLLIFIITAIVGYFIFYFFRKKKKSEPLFRPLAKPHIPPHRAALDNLEELRYKKLWQIGKIKEYHTELTDIIREYLSGMFAIHALEYTSNEIMDAVDKTAANEQAKEKLKQTLLIADLLKFAKMHPLPIEHNESLNNAIDFVNETKHLSHHQYHDEQNTLKPEPHEQFNIPALQEKSLIDSGKGKEVQDV
ncbi:MAG: hypothetical protein K8S16_11885 [Bacteroidales bacterium]|nr:hypothetical protein [Bacteroidales bacterium]